MHSKGRVDESLVSPQDLEALLASVASRSGDSRSGLFGPESISWRIDRESALFLGAGRAALLQLAHPWVAAALVDHSNLLKDPIARFHNTFRVVFTMIFGTREQAFRSSRRLYALHARIRGELPEGVGRYPRNSHYEANEISALRWVFATLVESGLIAYECVLPPLTADEREQYYAESKTTAALFGIPERALPSDWTAFTAYCEEMVRSDGLGVSDQARVLGQNLLRGAGSRVRPPHWYRALTVWWMPSRLRNEFGFDLNDSDRRAAARALRWLPRAYRRLPRALRFVGPYREAECRLGGRAIDATVLWSNRFWIGQSRLLAEEE